MTPPLTSSYKQENELRSGGWQFWREHTERKGTIPKEEGVALWEREGLAKTRVSDWASG